MLYKLLYTPAIGILHRPTPKNKPARDYTFHGRVSNNGAPDTARVTSTPPAPSRSSRGLPRRFTHAQLLLMSKRDFTVYYRGERGRGGGGDADQCRKRRMRTHVLMRGEFARRKIPDLGMTRRYSTPVEFGTKERKKIAKDNPS